MKVIFIKDLKKQGKVNDIKEVSDGYAMNYLIKNGYAVKYSKTSSNILNEKLDKEKKEDEKKTKEANNIKSKIEKEMIVFEVKSNNGKVFGSISSKQLEEKIKELGYKIEKKSIKLDTPLSSLGIHNIKIELYKKVVANIKVQLISK